VLKSTSRLVRVLVVSPPHALSRLRTVCRTTFFRQPLHFVVMRVAIGTLPISMGFMRDGLLWIIS
jgi:hypothetical protein